MTYIDIKAQIDSCLQRVHGGVGVRKNIAARIRTDMGGLVLISLKEHIWLLQKHVRQL